MWANREEISLPPASFSTYCSAKTAFLREQLPRPTVELIKCESRKELLTVIAMFIENLLCNSQALFQGHYVETHLILRVQTRKLRPREVSALAQSLPALTMRPWNQTHTGSDSYRQLYLQRLFLLAAPKLTSGVKKQAQVQNQARRQIFWGRTRAHATIQPGALSTQDSSCMLTALHSAQILDPT